MIEERPPLTAEEEATEHLVEVVDSTIELIEDRLANLAANGQDTKLSISDLVKLLQLRKDLEGDRPRTTYAFWVDDRDEYLELKHNRDKFEEHMARKKSKAAENPGGHAGNNNGGHAGNNNGGHAGNNNGGHAGNNNGGHAGNNNGGHPENVQPERVDPTSRETYIDDYRTKQRK